jgi:plasmid stability protein
MPTLSVKNLPDDLYESLKKAAKMHHRSINNEVIACLENNLKTRIKDTEDLLTTAERLRGLSASFKLTDDVISASKGYGRH